MEWSVFRDCWWVPDQDPNPDPEYYDCNGDLNGTAFDAAYGVDALGEIREFHPAPPKTIHVMELEKE